jgi:hypothetical protein
LKLATTKGDFFYKHILQLTLIAKLSKQHRLSTPVGPTVEAESMASAAKEDCALE